MKELNEKLFTMAKFMGAHQILPLLPPTMAGHFYWYWTEDFNPVVVEVNRDYEIVYQKQDCFSYYVKNDMSIDLPFNKDWNWLMRVCSKANDIIQNQQRPSPNHCNDLDWLECEITIAMR